MCAACPHNIDATDVCIINFDADAGGLDLLSEEKNNIDANPLLAQLPSSISQQFLTIFFPENQLVVDFVVETK